jgi:hypothetical protein
MRVKAKRRQRKTHWMPKKFLENFEKARQDRLKEIGSELEKAQKKGRSRIKVKVRAIEKVQELYKTSVEKKQMMIKENIHVSDKRIEMDKVIKNRSLIRNKRADFKSARTLDRLNEMMPSRLNTDESKSTSDVLSPKSSISIVPDDNDNDHTSDDEEDEQN